MRGVVLALAAVGGVPGTASPVPPLSFLGFRAGVSLAETDGQVRLLLGAGLACRRSAVDPRLQECRATVTDPVDNRPLAIWLAAIDSTTGVVTVSATVPAADFTRWRDNLEAVYGPRPATVQGGQGMVQWIQDAQMLRLTWRGSANQMQASVSLVDGPVLDGWNLPNAASPRIAKPRSPG